MRCATYVSYLNSAGVITSALIMILFVGGQVLALLADISLESWSSSAENQKEGCSACDECECEGSSVCVGFV